MQARHSDNSPPANQLRALQCSLEYRLPGKPFWAFVAVSSSAAAQRLERMLSRSIAHWQRVRLAPTTADIASLCAGEMGQELWVRLEHCPQEQAVRLGERLLFYRDLAVKRQLSLVFVLHPATLEQLPYDLISMASFQGPVEPAVAPPPASRLATTIPQKGLHYRKTN